MGMQDAVTAERTPTRSQRDVLELAVKMMDDLSLEQRELLFALRKGKRLIDLAMERKVLHQELLNALYAIYAALGFSRAPQQEDRNFINDALEYLGAPEGDEILRAMLAKMPQPEEVVPIAAAKKDESCIPSREPLRRITLSTSIEDSARAVVRRSRQLSPERMAHFFCEADGLSYQETAALLGCTLGSAKSTRSLVGRRVDLSGIPSEQRKAVLAMAAKMLRSEVA
jgi:DNA-directed RNA polymerase specialized sigma24 family protein